MILAAIDWLPITINLLLVVFVVVCLLMTLLILMQRPKQEGLGAAFGASVTDQVFGARTTNVLQRGTVYLGSMFFILSLVLAILIGRQNKQKGLTHETKPPVTSEKSNPASSANPVITPPSPRLCLLLLPCPCRQPLRVSPPPSQLRLPQLRLPQLRLPSPPRHLQLPLLSQLPRLPSPPPLLPRKTHRSPAPARSIASAARASAVCWKNPATHAASKA